MEQPLSQTDARPAEFRIRRRVINAYIGLGILSFLLSMIATLWGIWNWYFAYGHYGPVVVWKWASGPLWSGLILALLGSTWLLAAYHAWAYRVIIHESGIRDNRWIRKCTLPWGNIEGIRTSSVKFGLPGIMLGKRTTIWVLPKQGKKIRFPNALDRLDAFVDMIKTHIYQGLLERYRESLQQGLPLDFGPIKLTSKEIALSRVKIPWDQVHSVSLERGRLILRSGADGRTKTKILARKVLNVDLVVQLIQKMEFHS